MLYVRILTLLWNYLIGKWLLMRPKCNVAIWTRLFVSNNRLNLRFTIFFSVSPLNVEEIENLVKDKNVTDEQYIIWTDFERINLTHFRTSIFCRQPLQLRSWTAWRSWHQFNHTFKTLEIRSISSGRFPLVTRNTHEFHNFYYASSKFEIEAKKHFYDTVLAHGDGTIINRQTPKHISLGIFSNSLKNYIGFSFMLLKV